MQLIERVWGDVVPGTRTSNSNGSV